MPYLEVEHMIPPTSSPKGDGTVLAANREYDTGASHHHSITRQLRNNTQGRAQSIMRRTVMLLEAMVPQPTKKARHSHNHARYAPATGPQCDDDSVFQQPASSIPASGEQSVLLTCC
jgi:hypothetical protein